MSPSFNADLHCHSVISDGTLTPEQLAQRAKTNGVQLWALTDHDEVDGQARAAAAATAIGLDYLTGVEISVSFLGKTVHIVGLGFAADNAPLWHCLQRLRSGRIQRAHDMADDLDRVGIKGAFEGALTYAGNPSLISRTHFARFMVKAGVCKDTYEVFRKYLTEGKPGYVEHRWATLKDAVSWIRDAGGVAVVAHPARYQFSANEEFALFTEFKGFGGQGVEVITGSHSCAEYVTYADMASELGLAASIGSDFHSPDESRTDLGTLPELPARLPPVWALLQSQIQRAPSTATATCSLNNS